MSDEKKLKSNDDTEIPIRDGRGRVDVILEEGRTLHLLQKYAPQLARGQWATPLGIVVTIAVVLPSADLRFEERRAFLTGQQWTVVIWVAMSLAIAWLAVALVRRRTRLTPEQLLDLLCNNAPLSATEAVPPVSLSPVSARKLPELGQTIRHQKLGRGRVIALRTTTLGPEALADFPPPVGQQAILLELAKWTIEQ